MRVLRAELASTAQICVLVNRRLGNYWAGWKQRESVRCVLVARIEMSGCRILWVPVLGHGRAEQL